MMAEKDWLNDIRFRGVLELRNIGSDTLFLISVDKNDVDQEERRTAY